MTMESVVSQAPAVITGKVEDQVSEAVQNFQGLYQEELKKDRDRFPNEPEDDYRVLKQTLRSSAFVKAKISNKDIRDLVDFLLSNDKFREPFEGWIKYEELHREQKTLPQNTNRVCVIGKIEISKRSVNGR